jgi:hypothetical protein
MPKLMVMTLQSEAEERKLSPAAGLAHHPTLRHSEAAYTSSFRGRLSFVIPRPPRPRNPRGAGWLSRSGGQLVPVRVGTSEESELLRAAPDKTNQPGRAFAFAVLGSAPNEQAWSDAMDGIDETRKPPARSPSTRA